MVFANVTKLVIAQNPVGQKTIAVAAKFAVAVNVELDALLKIIALKASSVKMELA